MTDDVARLDSVWRYPTEIRFGVGRIAELAKACRTLGMTRPLLVTDPGLAVLPAVADAVAANRDAGVPTAVFSGIKGNPTGGNVEAGVRAFRDGGHDGIVALGGGSSLDAGKTIAFMAGQTRRWEDYALDGPAWRQADPTGVPPIVAVPTTAGTGSEVGRAAVIVDEATETKKILLHPKMLPGIVIADPALTVGLPPHLTAATGMDALAHCLEAYSTTEFHPMSTGIALEGMRLIKAWLPEAYRDGRNLTARAHMMAAASMGATAFQKGLGAIHALSHPVGAVYDTHHGLTNAVFMPYVLAFNRPAVEARMGRLAAYLDLPAASFDAVMDWVLTLRRQLDVPHTLAELGVPDNRAAEIARMAAADPCAAENPVELDVMSLRRIFDAAMAGRLD
ncbi:MAG: iron-containing alcohol dehydrogenase [Kiloniellales bacterium]